MSASSRRVSGSPSASVGSSMTSSGAGADKTRQYREETEAMMLKQHDQDLDLLDSQVERMRMVSLEIGEEAEEHNRLLDTMQDSMLSVRGFLGGSMTRLQTMVNSNNTKHMCLLALGIFLFVVLFYYLVL